MTKFQKITPDSEEGRKYLAWVESHFTSPPLTAEQKEDALELLAMARHNLEIRAGNNGNETVRISEAASDVDMELVELHIEARRLGVTKISTLSKEQLLAEIARKKK